MAIMCTMNASYVERVQLRVEPPPQDPDPDVIINDGTMRKEQADTPPKRVDLSDDNIGQVSPSKHG